MAAPQGDRAVNRRFAALLGSAGLGFLALAGSASGGPHPLLVYNPTPSAPRGFYTVSPPRDLHVGDMVIVAVPPSYRPLVTERRYIGAGVALIKRIVALGGDLVCEHEGAVAVNGRLLAQALAADGRGRPMPVWEGCRQLGDGEFFALMDLSPYSLDSRYFGPLPTALIIGKARALWVF
jgi:conjugative transfer signal peptidase TraF